MIQRIGQSIILLLEDPHSLGRPIVFAEARKSLEHDGRAFARFHLDAEDLLDVLELVLDGVACFSKLPTS